MIRVCNIHGPSVFVPVDVEVFFVVVGQRSFKSVVDPGHDQRRTEVMTSDNRARSVMTEVVTEVMTRSDQT